MAIAKNLSLSGRQKIETGKKYQNDEGHLKL